MKLCAKHMKGTENFRSQTYSRENLVNMYFILNT